LRYPDSFPLATTLTVGTVTTTGGYRIYTFNDSGTIGWS
jgi:20S proteasome alpha/beta subunit